MRFFGKKELIVMAVSVALTTAGIKAADRFLGDKAGGGDEGQCPAGMVYVVAAGGGFCIDKYEASAGRDCAYADPGSRSDTRLNLSGKGCQPVSKPGSLPWRYISQDQAALACAKAGKRLPTNQEWFAAALGTPDPTRGWGRSSCQVNGNWEEQPGPSGSGIDCVSACGAYDMIGNVWEWVGGTVRDGLYEGNELPPAGFVAGTDGGSMPAATAEEPDPDYFMDYLFSKQEGVRGIARGGYWDNKGDAGQYSMYVVSPPANGGPGTGFRCAK